MAVVLSYPALLTATEVVRDAVDSTTLKSPASNDVIHQAVIDLTDLVETYLDRTLIVRLCTQFVCAYEWERVPGDPSNRYVAWARQWPLVEITGPDEVSIHPARKTQFITDSPGDMEISYFAGYRRADQDLTALQAATDPDDPALTPLAGLAVLPPLLPGAIRGACLELVLHRLFQAEGKQFGTGQTRQQIGSGQMATVQATDRGFVERVLKRLSTHRHLA